MRVIMLAIGLWGAVAHAHGASGAHESPRWCGGKLAVLADGGAWIDGALVAVAETQGLVAWSPACDRVVVVGEHAHVIDAGTHAVRELPLPGHFERAMRMEGPAPSIRFSASGKHFAVVLVNKTISDMHVALFEVAKGTSWLVGATGEVRAFALVDEDTALVAIRPAGDSATQLVRATAAGTTRVNRTDYGDARISVAPVVAVMFTTAKDLVLVDGASGTERTIAHQVDYLQAMSDDGTRALAVVNSHASSIELGGTVHPFGADLTYGLIADEDTGWSADGAFTIARGTGGLKIDDGARQRVWKLPAGDVSHLSIAPDGKRVAFLLEVAEPGKRGRHCDVESWGRIELYAGEVGATAKKLATVAHLHHCGIE